MEGQDEYKKVFDSGSPNRRNLPDPVPAGFAGTVRDEDQSEVISKYEDSVSYYNQEMVREEWEKAEEYNNSLSGTEVRDPFVPGSGIVIPDNYLEVLDIDRGMMGTLEIPCVDITLPIYHTVDPEVLEKGVGHLQETALPIGGENNHTVLSTHRGLPEAKLFTDLDKNGNRG